MDSFKRTEGKKKKTALVSASGQGLPENKKSLHFCYLQGVKLWLEQQLASLLSFGSKSNDRSMVNHLFLEFS